jgi:RNA 3'-terminal phosphate cyclase (ATP)
LRAKVDLKRWGWYPIGDGEFDLVVQPVRQLANLEWVERGELSRVTGVAAVTNLPAHIPQRMTNRARNILHQAKLASQVKPLRERGPAAGAGIFLTAHYTNGSAGFSALGRRGKPAEKVAEEACNALLQHHQNEAAAAVDPHLADQLVLPLALAAGDSTFTTGRVTQHLLTNIHIVQQFLGIQVRVERRGDGGTINIKGIGYHV